MADYQLALDLGRDAMRSGDYLGVSGRYYPDLTKEQRIYRAMADSEAIMEDVRSGLLDPAQHPELGHVALVVGLAIGHRFAPGSAAMTAEGYQDIFARAAPFAPTFK